MKIKQLPKEVYDLIAAGEVVLAPVSVVKELVENALDAGATRIIVDTAEGGKERIRVSDNGSGIVREDIELSFMPHSTSKLSSADDLSHIETLGFRGEALASIAAVSSVSMVTRAEGDSAGTRADSEGGGALKLTPAGADRGTDITVKELFFNLPARKKHLGDARGEGRKVTEYLAKAAVSRPDVAFRQISDGAPVFTTPGTGDRLAAIASAYGVRITDALMPVTAVSSGLKLEGYISGVLGLRANRKGQHIFVNGRPVANAIAIDSAVSRAYHEFAEPGRFPVVFLFIGIDPEMVDVNVHPSKNEVSFVDVAGTGVFVEEAIRKVLCSESVIPRLVRHTKQGAAGLFDIRSDGKTSLMGDENTLVSTSGGDGEKVVTVDINNLLSGENRENIGEIIGISGDEIVDKVVYHNILQSPQYPSQETPEADHVFAENLDTHYSQTLNIQNLRVLATLFATYMLATDGDAFYIIDQHAAHERVNFERFSNAVKNKDIVVQGLLAPYLFTIPAALGNMVEYTEFFAGLGFEIDEFGEKTWAARSFPAFVSFEEGEAFLLETLDALCDEKGKEAGISAAAEERVMMRACKAAVKGNMELSDEEGMALLEALSRCENPFTCPHGRPVFLKLTRGDIERLFKRV